MIGPNLTQELITKQSKQGCLYIKIDCQHLDTTIKRSQ